MASLAKLDISENKLRQKGDVLDILLIDRTTKRNIIWATDSYSSHGEMFGPMKHILPELISGVYGKIIQPRASKSIEEQKFRTREKAEVFTPLKIIDQMNKSIDWRTGNFPVNHDNWQTYVKELRLEIACGEAPYIVSRYNPTAHTGKVIELGNRVGFLDSKLRIISRYTDDPKDWISWAKEAYKASFGYEWQGDNVLIARENLFYTMLDYFKNKFGRTPSLDTQREFAEIISWNIFQMDGIKYVIPMSCRHETRLVTGELTLFGDTPHRIEKYECEGCKTDRVMKHNGKYAIIKDWSINKSIPFINLVEDNLKLVDI